MISASPKATGVRRTGTLAPQEIDKENQVGEAARSSLRLSHSTLMRNSHCATFALATAWSRMRGALGPRRLQIFTQFLHACAPRSPTPRTIGLRRLRLLCLVRRCAVFAARPSQGATPARWRPHSRRTMSSSWGTAAAHSFALAPLRTSAHARGCERSFIAGRGLRSACCTRMGGTMYERGRYSFASRGHQRAALALGLPCRGGSVPEVGHPCLVQVVVKPARAHPGSTQS